MHFHVHIDFSRTINNKTTKQKKAKTFHCQVFTKLLYFWHQQFKSKTKSLEVNELQIMNQKKPS